MDQRAEHKVNRNDPCPCGSKRKAKRCCGAYGPIGGPDAALLVELARERAGALSELCGDCQTGALLEVLELASKHKACRLSLARPWPPCLERLKVALADGDGDALADELVSALAEVDGPAARSRLARAVLGLEVAGRARPSVVAAALGDLSGKGPSMLVRSALLATLSAEAMVRPVRLAG